MSITTVSELDHKQYLNVPSVFRIATLDASPPAQTTVRSEALNRARASLTVHNNFHIVHETMDNLQYMRLHHAGLVLGEPVQSPQYILDLAVAQQLLCELLFKQIRESQSTDSVRDHLLSRPCLICFFAWPRMESNSTIILAIISVIKALKEILV